jgi:hypothetical protein
MSRYTGLTKGLIIKTPFIDLILQGRKTWELRSTQAKFRGPIALIEKGSGKVVGVASLIDSKGPLTDAEMGANHHNHAVSPERLQLPDLQKYRYAWVLSDAKRLARPVPYTHAKGAVIWVTLDSMVSSAVVAAAG